MRKIITQNKFDRLFEKLDDGLGKVNEKGELILSHEENDEWLKRLDELENKYIVVGPRVIKNKLLRIIKNN